jgi:hypothetical protein
MKEQNGRAGISRQRAPAWIYRFIKKDPDSAFGRGEPFCVCLGCRMLNYSPAAVEASTKTDGPSAPAMKLELFTLCDYAKGEPTGKLYVIGTYDHVLAAEAPIAMPPSAIASRLRFDEIEQGAKKVTVTFTDSDGAKVIPEIGMQMNIQLPPGESTTAANVVIILPQISLPRFGEYAIDLAVGSRLEGSIPLYVRQAAGGSAALRQFPAQA